MKLTKYQALFARNPMKNAHKAKERCVMTWVLSFLQKMRGCMNRHAARMCEPVSQRKFRWEHTAELQDEIWELQSAPFSLKPLVDGNRDGSALCTAAIVAGFQNSPSWRLLVLPNFIVSIIRSSRAQFSFAGIPLGKRNHPHQTCVFPSWSTESAKNVQK